MKASDMRDEITLWLEDQVPGIANNVGKWAPRFLSASATRINGSSEPRRYMEHFRLDDKQVEDTLAFHKRFRDHMIKCSDAVLEACHKTSQEDWGWENLKLKPTYIPPLDEIEKKWTKLRQDWESFSVTPTETDEIDGSACATVTHKQWAYAGKIDLLVSVELDLEWIALESGARWDVNQVTVLKTLPDRLAEKGLAALFDPAPTLFPLRAGRFCHHDAYAEMAFLVEPQINSLAKLFTRLHGYKTFIAKVDKKDPDNSIHRAEIYCECHESKYQNHDYVYTPIYVVSADNRFADKIKEQGFHFLKYEPVSRSAAAA